jgi:DNA uptake protein ComE-like DNA-binding protein
MSTLTSSDQDSVNIDKSLYNQPKEMFNPNSYSLEEWMDVGLSEKQSKSILKYLKSGAQLKVKSDMKKLYVVDDELYSLLEPKIDLPDSIVQNKFAENTESDWSDFSDSKSDDKNTKGKETKENIEVIPLSVNKATKHELQSIPGIGPFFAQEIIKMREKYGGIISSDQLLDIYKMDKEKLNELIPYLIIDKKEINKLDINKASEEQLRKHPLISRDMAKSIVFFRENHKKYESLNGLLLSPYIDGQVLKNIEPYLKVE